MKKSALTWLGWLCGVAPAFSTILLNEVHIDPRNTPAGDDGNYEFIELRSTTNGVEAATGLTIIIIDSNGGTRGEVEEAFSLDAFSTGANGLLFLGDDYADLPQGGPWSGSKDTQTTVGDPSGTGIFSSMGPDNLGPNEGLTVLVVSGWTGMSNAAAGSLGDVDVDNNSILDWLQNPKPAGSQQTQPWTTLIDAIGYRDDNNRSPYTSVILPRMGAAPGAAPGTVSRVLSNLTPLNSAAWYGGTIAGTASDGVSYDLFFGTFKGQATPGKPNLNAAPAPPNFLINEVSINPPGPEDANFEFIEIMNTVENSGSKSASLQGYALVVLNSNAGNGTAALGQIVEAWDLGALSTGSNGLLLIGDDYQSAGIPWGNIIDPMTQRADPEAPAVQNPIRYTSMGGKDIGDNNGFTLLLVQGYTGTALQDLDTDNNGVLDVQPWTSITDSVGFDQVVTGAGKSYATAKFDTGYDIDFLARIRGNTTPNSTAAWYGGEYGGNSPTSIGLKQPVIGPFKGEATPSRENLDADAVAGPIRINEVHFDPVAEPDGAFEYIELITPNLGITGLNGVSLVIADASGNPGRVVEAIDIGMISTGSNGLMIIGDGYDTFSPYADLIAPQTNREDPQGVDVDNFGPNNGLTVLLVQGAVPAIGSDVAAIPPAAIIDSIGFGTTTNASIALVAPAFPPDSMARLHLDFDANSADSWYGAELDPIGGGGSIVYGANFFPPSFKGAASPGRYSHTAIPSNSATLLLNEININPPGADNEKEFIELRSNDNQSISTNGYSILLIDVDGTNTGSVLEHWSLDGMSTGTNGLLLIGNNYTTPGALPWTGTAAPDAATHLGYPLGMDFDDIGGATSNGATLVMLVRDFKGRAGDDLDAALPSGVADDGTFDNLPPAQRVDSAGVRFWDASALPPALDGRVYAGTADLSQTGYTPDSVARMPGNLTAHTAAAWYGGDIDTTAGTSTEYDAVQKFPLDFPGAVTPGKPNVSLFDDLGDPDNDQVVNLLEEGLAMNPNVSDAQKLPVPVVVDVGGVDHPALQFTRLKTPGTLTYTVEASTTLQTWSSGTGSTVEVSAVDDPNGTTQTVIVRADTALLAQPPVFLRLRINRS